MGNMQEVITENSPLPDPLSPFPLFPPSASQPTLHFMWWYPAYDTGKLGRIDRQASQSPCRCGRVWGQVCRRVLRKVTRRCEVKLVQDLYRCVGQRVGKGVGLIVVHSARSKLQFNSKHSDTRPVTCVDSTAPSCRDRSALLCQRTFPPPAAHPPAPTLCRPAPHPTIPSPHLLPQQPHLLSQL